MLPHGFKPFCPTLATYAVAAVAITIILATKSVPIIFLSTWCREYRAKTVELEEEQEINPLDSYLGAGVYILRTCAYSSSTGSGSISFVE
jgi:hypothetical protein